MSRLSPTQRTLALLRERGYLAVVVEKFNSRVGSYGIKQDLFGFGDVLAIKKGEILLVQTTTGAHLSNRVAKVQSSEHYPRVIESGIKVAVHGWRKLKAAGWECREIQL